MRRRWRSLLLGVAAMLCGLVVHAQPQSRPSDERVVIVSSDTTSAFVEVAQVLIDGLVRDGLSRYDVRQLTTSELVSLVKAGQTPHPRVFVALGTEASAALASGAGATPVLSALLPRSSFERVLQASGRKTSSQFTALYLDQPLSRQMALIHLALPAAQRVGVLLGQESVLRAPALRSLAQANGLTLVEALADSPKTVFPRLKTLLDECDVLLALADPQVYNSNSLQNILLTTFREKVPMVAFSPAYVRAGALMSLHVTPAQVGSQALGLVQLVLRDQTLPASAVESRDFEVGVNEHVARSLGLTLDASALRLELRRLERLP